MGFLRWFAYGASCQRRKVVFKPPLIDPIWKFSRQEWFQVRKIKPFSVKTVKFAKYWAPNNSAIFQYFNSLMLADAIYMQDMALLDWLFR